MKLSRFIFIFSLSLSSSFFQLGFCYKKECIAMATTLGGFRDTSCDGTRNDGEIESLARFAVKEHNKNQNEALQFVKVVKAEEQVVAGILHKITVEVIDADKKKLYEAKVFAQPWMDFKQLQEFKHLGDSPSFTRSDLGVKQDEQGSGWKTVPTHDPVVRDAADHAVKTIHQRSNALFPYELVEIVNAKAEVVEGSAKFELYLKVKRGSKEENFLVEVHKNLEGTFHLNKMQQEPERSETAN